MKPKKQKSQSAPKPENDVSTNLDKLRAKLDASLNESQQASERQEALSAPQMPPQVILRARQLEKKGKFTKPIVKRTPLDMRWDSAELECGHQIRIFGSSEEASNTCRECTEAWLLRQARKAKR